MLIRKKTDKKSSVTKRSIELAKLATLKKYNFLLNKSEFKDGLHLRYEWKPPNTPHEIRDTFATLLDEVCHDVEIEPKLQSLEGESFHNKTTATEDDARIDIKANGLWGDGFSRTFFDGKTFNPQSKPCPTTTNIMTVSKH